MRRDVDFFSVYRNPIDAKGGLDRVAVIGLSLIAVCTAVIIGIFVYAQVGSLTLQNQISGIQRYLSRSDVTKAGQTVLDGDRKLDALRQYGTMASSNIQEFGKLTAPDSALFQAVTAAAPAGTAVSDVQYSDSRLTISCTASSSDAAVAYTAALQQTGRFRYITYGGVTQSGTGYEFAIQCTLKGGSAS